MIMLVDSEWPDQTAQTHILAWLCSYYNSLDDSYEISNLIFYEKKKKKK